MFIVIFPILFTLAHNASGMTWVALSRLHGIGSGSMPSTILRSLLSFKVALGCHLSKLCSSSDLNFTKCDLLQLSILFYHYAYLFACFWRVSHQGSLNLYILCRSIE
jgi:hypothetical protein